ncbi:pyrroline-5-carboxylate reductase [Poseidonocella sedimentorum]|uniref:Pyrroline-5-carboxylate reductase n=1 Tax=Poseidonocella sedimentorum TaxID=871652 RepID=A0A1I6DYE9_9RHOB|nr:pyrroline-5-carboxylate reductase [Poseidonocella sedimentorum]SFR10407.1 pyrroline-5-carboxylate reductase [Poseidonocella sedimentorum]
MALEEVSRRGLVLLGCGRMGTALLKGWLERGLAPGAVTVLDPAPADWLAEAGVRVNAALPADPAIAMIAVKPQMMGDALPALQALGNGRTLFVSIAAGTPIAQFEESFGSETPIVRSMPNTPAAIGKGVTAMIGNDAARAQDLDLAEELLAAVGSVVRLEREDQIDAVTGVSGSGPAYVFYMIECLAAAGEAQGLAPDLALELAKATVEGAGALAAGAAERPATLRDNVTSPNGTTQAGLAVLMDEGAGLAPLIARTVEAATARSKELANG